MGAQDYQVRRPAGGRFGGAQLARWDPDGAEAMDWTERGCKVRVRLFFAGFRSGCW